jgi:hypothetical protein
MAVGIQLVSEWESFMARRFDPKSSPQENLQIFLHSIPLKLLLLFPIILVVAIPTYIYAAHAGSGIVPSMTNLFYGLSNVSTAPTPTPMPAYPAVLPRVGSISYTVADGDNCDEILSSQMHMYSASQVFSDANAPTVAALNQALGEDCHRLQPGMSMKLSPQYPLMAFGGVVTKISGTAREAVPTPLIPVPNQQDQGPDCSKGCLLAVRISPEATVKLTVQTTLPLKIGAWVWAEALMERKHISGFDNYPYVDPSQPINGMALSACDFQVNDTHDDNSLSCSDVKPNTIDDDGGAWVVGVTGSGGLDHWHYKIKASPGTQILAWLTSDDNGGLQYHPGDPVYRYDNNAQMYVKL